MAREHGRFIRFLRRAALLRDLIALVILQSRVGRVMYAFFEGAVARG